MPVTYRKELLLRCDAFGCQAELKLDYADAPSPQFHNVDLGTLRGRARREHNWQLLPEARCRCPEHKLEA